MASPGFQSSPQVKWCTRCGAQVHEPSKFCSVCGTPTEPNQNTRVVVEPEIIPQLPKFSAASPHQAVAHGFGSIFGLHPGIAVFVIAVNIMLFGTAVLGGTIGAILTLGASWGAIAFLCVLAGLLVGAVTYMGQRKWYGDDEESAKIKALIAGIVTAIPSGLPGVLFGGIGFLNALFRRKA